MGHGVRLQVEPKAEELEGASETGAHDSLPDFATKSELNRETLTNFNNKIDFKTEKPALTKNTYTAIERIHRQETLAGSSLSRVAVPLQRIL